MAPKGWSGLFYPPNGSNFQFCLFNLIFLIAPSWSESSFILFLFFYSIRVGPSRSELIRPGLAVRVDPVQLLYLPLLNPKKVLLCFQWARTGLELPGIWEVPMPRWPGFYSQKNLQCWLTSYFKQICKQYGSFGFLCVVHPETKQRTRY